MATLTSSLVLMLALGAVGAITPTSPAQAQSMLARARTVDPAELPAGIRVLHDVAYGADAKQRFDVYVPAHAKAAPVIFMVHGGGWRRGDKGARGVVLNKVKHWLPRGFIVISVNYPLLPGANPLQQARSVALALAVAQRDAPEWGGNRHAFVLMGHSAGAHLVSLISAEPELASSAGALPWLGTVALDSAAFNVSTIMLHHHYRLYDAAFGKDPEFWKAVSPIAQLQTHIAPFLAVCSSLRKDSCPQARAFVERARALGSQAKVLPEPLRHGQINAELGQDSTCTTGVDAFLAGLAPALAARLHDSRPSPRSSREHPGIIKT